MITIILVLHLWSPGMEGPKMQQVEMPSLEECYKVAQEFLGSIEKDATGQFGAGCVMIKKPAE